MNDLFKIVLISQLFLKYTTLLIALQLAYTIFYLQDVVAPSFGKIFALRRVSQLLFLFSRPLWMLMMLHHPHTRLDCHTQSEEQQIERVMMSWP